MRLVGIEAAQSMHMIDVDATCYVEYDHRIKVPLLLIEEARDICQDRKPATVTRNLAIMAGIQAFVVLWTPSQEKNPADNNWPDILKFRVRRIAPLYSRFVDFTPEQWANKLLSLRKKAAARLDSSDRMLW